MKLLGLLKDAIHHVPVKYNGDLVYRTETHAIGGGEWSIECYDNNNSFIKEFVGLNGTRDNEEPTDLWAEYEEWAKQPATQAYSYWTYKAPDGTCGSWQFFAKELQHGRLHGCLLQL